MNENVSVKEVLPVCPYCKAVNLGMSMRVDAIPGVTTAGVTTFCCPSCGSVLGLCWMPRSVADELKLSIPATQN
jgi:C4-type Zn-finger protein